jgi:hypothetical protein
MEIARNYRKNEFLRVTGEPVFTGNFFFDHYKFGQNSDAKKRLSPPSLVLSEHMDYYSRVTLKTYSLFF